MKKVLILFLFIILTEMAGITGSLFTISAIPGWYMTLDKPFFNPPNWIFGPVWTILYALMGISVFLVYEKFKRKINGCSAITFFAVQLLLNVLWSVIFFGLHNPFLAFLEIIILWIMIIKTALEFYKISKMAGLLFIPYIIWVSFASILNLSIVILN